MFRKNFLSFTILTIVSLFYSEGRAAEAAPPLVLAGDRVVDRNVTYDEGGKTLFVRPSCQFIIHDDCSLLIKDATLKGVRKDTFRFLGNRSGVVLKNVTLEFCESCNFQRGNIVFLNNVILTKDPTTREEITLSPWNLALLGSSRNTSLTIKDISLKNVRKTTFRFREAEKTRISLNNAILELVDDVEWNCGILAIERTPTFRSGLERPVSFTFSGGRIEKSEGQTIIAENVALNLGGSAPGGVSVHSDGVHLSGVMAGGRVRSGGSSVSYTPSSDSQPFSEEPVADVFDSREFMRSALGILGAAQREWIKPARPIPPIRPIPPARPVAPRGFVPGGLHVCRSGGSVEVRGVHVAGDLNVGSGAHSSKTLALLRAPRPEAPGTASASAAPVGLEEFLSLRHSNPDVLVARVFERGAQIDGFIGDNIVEYRMPAGTDQVTIKAMLNLQ